MKSHINKVIKEMKKGMEFGFEEEMIVYYNGSYYKGKPTDQNPSRLTEKEARKEIERFYHDNPDVLEEDKSLG